MTDETVPVIESAAAPLLKKGKKWLVTLAVPGVGARGEKFPAEVLEKTGPIAVPAGTKSYFKHAATEERDPRDQVGVFKDGAFWNEEEQKLQAWLTPFPRYETVLDEAGKSIEASLSVRGRKDPKDPKLFRELTFRRDNTVDLVAFGGLEGSGLEYSVVESLFAAAAAEIEEEENTMAFEITEKMWSDHVAAVAAGFATFDAYAKQSADDFQGAADADAVKELVDAGVKETLAALSEVEASIDAADIPVEVKESLKSKAREGEDISATLDAAVSITAAAKKEFVPAPKTTKRATVVVAESLNSDDDDKTRSLRIDGWKRN